MSETTEKTHVIVKPFSTVEIRQPIEVLMSKPEYKKQRDLFLQGFAKVQQRDANDPKSFFAVAGIHGIPYVPYDLLPGETIPSTDWNKSDPNRWGGYCHHGDILFPTWHRPYVLLLEMLIYEAAKEIVNSYDAGKETDEYIKEVEKVRFPYWDWASPSTLALGIPSVLFDEYVFVDDPKRKNFRIRNPLRAYTAPVDVGTLLLVGDISNPTQRPYNPGTETPYTPAGYATVRHPDSNYLTNVDATNLNVVTFCSSVLRPTIYQVLLANEWPKFSNHGNSLDKVDGNYGHFSSIEVVHDAVHDAIGGTGGHMTYPDIASFDPIFFLHHANVDRLIAIWQACHPDVWIIGNDYTEGTFTAEYNEQIDKNTDLTPFRKTKDTYWNSDDVRYIETLGYNYPELIEPNNEKLLVKTLVIPELTKPDNEKLLIKMLEYYHPNIYLPYHWKLTLTVKKNKVGSPFQIRVFLDLPTADASTPVSSPNFAGLVSVFARGNNTKCGNCTSNPEAVVNGSVDLTTCMQRLFIDLNVEPNPDGTIDSENASLKANQITLVVVLNNGSGMSLKDAGLITADYWAIDEVNNNQPEQWKSYYVGNVYPYPSSNLIKLRCGFQDRRIFVVEPHKEDKKSFEPRKEDNKIFVVEPRKEDKVSVLEFAIKTLLANQGYQALSSNFDLYVNDPQETGERNLMESTEEISKYLYKLLSVKDDIQIFIKPKNS